MSKILLIIITLIIILFILSIILKKNRSIKGTNLNLQKNGVIVIKNILNDDDIKFLLNNDIKNNYDYITNNKNIRNKINNILNEHYEFHKYLFYIKKSKFHTCHRDGNAKYYHNNIKYPSYTIIFYLSNINKCLDVILNSHNNFNKIYITDTTTSILCNKGDALIFDASIIHSGSFNKYDEYPRIQMKLTHKDDFGIINFYNNYYKTLDKNNKVNCNIKMIQKHISCQLPFMNDLFYNEINNDIVNKEKTFFEKLYWTIFYGDNKYF